MDALQALADVFYACVGTGAAVRHPPVRRASIRGDDRPPLKGGGILLQPRVTVEHPALMHATRERIGGGALQLVTGLFESGVFEELDNAVRATYAQTFRPLVDKAALWASDAAIRRNGVLYGGVWRVDTCTRHRIFHGRRWERSVKSLPV